MSGARSNDAERAAASYARRMANAWFESVGVAQRRAKRRLPKSVYMALIAGADRGVTLADNVAAFGELRPAARDRRPTGDARA